ncbi:DoxX family membrane protein [Streptomyces sp. NPDC058572]|uniref:DoxX family membrane protein n=1 Tax=Streptomyces sp. NPDC058572 TaxID=3346546 RepID=UPI003658F17B
MGRIPFVLLFLGSGVAHFAQTKAMAGYAAAHGLPVPVPAPLFSGVVLLAGGLSVLHGIRPGLGALLPAAFLFPTAFLMHAF